MKKINKLISTILSMSMLASFLTVFTVSAEEGAYKLFGKMPLSRMKAIDKKGYTDKYEIREDTILFRYDWTLEDLENLNIPDDNKKLIDPAIFTLPEYYYCNEQIMHFEDGVYKLCLSIDDIGLLFLTYTLDTEEEYNQMSEYLAENYPDLELIKIDREKLENDNSEAGRKLKRILFLQDDNIYMLKNIDDYLATSEEEMFEIAVQIQKDLGYDIPFIVTQDVPPFCEFVYGDANFDEELSVADVVALSAYIGNAENNPICDFAVIISDVHNRGDGITANDVLMIQQYLAGIIDSL